MYMYVQLGDDHLIVNGASLCHAFGSKVRLCWSASELLCQRGVKNDEAFDISYTFGHKDIAWRYVLASGS